MRKRVYIETTVVSYLTARDSRDLMLAAHQQATRELWQRLATDYDPYVSALVHQEAGRGDPDQAAKRLDAIKPFPVLDVDDESRRVAQRLIDGNAIPSEYPEDALHIAVATVNGMDVLITWNFAHIGNPFTRMMVRQTIENEGYDCPEICSPEELLEIDR